MTRLAAPLLLLLLIAWPSAAPAQAPAGAWTAEDQAIRSPHAGIAFPRQAGPVSVTRTGEFSREGEFLDNIIQYRSPDNAIFGTVYLYYPGLAHSGLAALATDFAIMANSDSPVRALASRVVDAGGREGVAIRNDYANYRGRFASSAAFIKLDRWLVKLRVSGPKERRAEVEAAMAALLDGLRFGNAANPRPAAPIALAPCPAGSADRPANPIPDPPAAEIAAHAMLATFDGGGIAGVVEGSGERRGLPSRVPDSFCMSTPVGSQRPIIRAAAGAPLSIDGRSMLFVVIGDNGELLELVHAANLGGYVLLHHRIGATAVLGRYDGVPSDSQIEELFTTRDHPAARIRAMVEMGPGQTTRVHVPSLEEEPAAPPVPVT